jgi:protein-tyrosine phosphatase
MAEALLARRLGDAGVDARVHSAGLLSDGSSPPSDGVEVMKALGLDTSAHLSRRLTPEMLRDADLVVAMAREHAREAALLETSAWPKCFTLKEIVRRGGEAGPRRPDEPLADWLARLHATRTSSDMLGASIEDDVEDPIGRKRAFYERTAEELDDLTARLAKLIAG